MPHLTIICATAPQPTAPPGFAAAAVVPVAAASPLELEAALLTGFAPEYQPMPPFWLRAGAPARVRTGHHPQWNTDDPAPRLILAPGNTSDLPAEGTCACVTAGRDDQFGVLYARGFEIPKPIIGLLELAHLFQRVLTGERLADAL